MSGPHFDPGDVYHPRDSFVHRLDPRARLLVTVAFVVAVNLVPGGAWAAFAGLWILALGASAASRLGVLFALRRSWVALPFLIAALPLAFTTPGHAVWGSATDAGLLRVATILARALLSVQVAVLLAATTRFADLAWALGRLGAPAALVSIATLGYRYLFVVADEVLRMTRGRKARCARPADGRAPSAWWQARVAGRMAGTLFLRSLERSERVYGAMLARGYDGRARATTAFRMRGADWATVAGSLATLGLLALFTIR